MLKTIINLAKINIISQYRISEKLLVFILPIIILGLNTKSILPSLINLVFCIICIKKLEVPFMVYWKFIKGISFFIIMGTIPIVIDKSFDLAIIIIFRSISSVSSIFLFSVTTPMDSIFYELNKKHFLKEFSEIGRTMMRFIIIMEEEFIRIKIAMDSRLGFLNRKNMLRNYAKVMGLLFINMIRRWKEMEESLLSRGYNGQLSFTYSEKKKRSKILVLGIVYSLFLMVLTYKLERV